MLVRRRNANRPFLSFPQTWVKPKKSNVSGLPRSRARRVRRRTGRTDQPRLLARQLQAEPRKPFAQLSEEPLGILTMLKPTM